MYTNNNIIFDVTEYKPGRNTMLMPSYLDQQNYFEVNTSEIYDHFSKHCRFDRTNIEINIIVRIFYQNICTYMTNTDVNTEIIMQSLPLFTFW